MWERLQQIGGAGGIGAAIWLMTFFSLTGRADDGAPLLSDFWASNVATAAGVMVTVGLWRAFAPPRDNQDDSH
jgi:hypothetical protein